MRSSVDLPQPEGPTRTTNSPSSISSETSSTATHASGELLRHVVEHDPGHARDGIAHIGRRQDHEGDVSAKWY